MRHHMNKKVWKLYPQFLSRNRKILFSDLFTETASFRITGLGVAVWRSFFLPSF